jgi:hypothetical protein
MLIFLIKSKISPTVKTGILKSSAKLKFGNFWWKKNGNPVKTRDYTDEKSDYNGISQSSGHYVIRIDRLVRLGRFDRLVR